MAIHPDVENDNVPPPTKRSRWANQRLRSNEGGRERTPFIERLPTGLYSGKKRETGGTDSAGTVTTGPEPSLEHEAEESGPRKVFFNIPLPPEALDENNHPVAQFTRNKTRTAKYTPLSFVPKNLFHQFHNIANVYFLFLDILAAFRIFGASNPVLNAVPLLFIIVITAVKDAIEDYRRMVLDNELNNSPVHRLMDWTNVNVSLDNVSVWRRLKKASTRFLIGLPRSIKALGIRAKEGEEKTPAESTLCDQRPSVETRTTRHESAYSAHSQRISFASYIEDIEMTPVPCPHRREEVWEATQDKTAITDLGVVTSPTKKDSGDIVNHHLPVSGKARFHQDCWKNVQVGDFVRIYNDDPIPADVVILATSDAEGVCYIETKNLDGETNLKLRHALNCGQSLKHARDCERAEFFINSEGAQPNLYQYSGVAHWTQKNRKFPNAESEAMSEAISINNMLLRGCSLRNTEWILGVVVFTGADTKIMINAGITPSKRSRIARELKWNVIFNFVILLIMCIISGLVQGLKWAERDNSLDFFEFGSIGGTPSLDGFITFWSAVILFQNLVPISLYITLEVICTAQAFLIYSDVHMYYDRLDYPCTPKSWNISDDLGQIEYIFSDKTGTLTQNVMEFKKATVNGVPYGEAYTEAQAGMQRKHGIDTEKEDARARQQIAQDRVEMLAEIRRLHYNQYLHDDELTFVAPKFVADLAGDSGVEQKIANEQFMLALALCHTVISETVPGDPPRIVFKAQSPDEAALVATARDVGFTVLGNSHDRIRLNVMGEERDYTIMNILEFNSTRKRMSVIIRMPDGKLILFCKGADSTIYSRLKKGEQEELRRCTAEHLEMFAMEGLRTLCIARRYLDEQEYENWDAEYKLAANTVHDREGKLERAAQLIEQELTLLGGTAIEDRLQEGVPNTIALLAEAGIKLWVLTGDKIETAINIGFSCNLLNNDMELITFKIEDQSVATAEAQLDHYLGIFDMTGSDEELKIAMNTHEPPASTHAIVIDGDSLRLVLDDTLRQKFLLLCKQCKSVLCCRVSPAQKAAVVQMVKSGLDVMTLSIGDGANDVAMIQAADVGVGIAGEEGRQAVMSSDYAIGQFRFLQRLVLVHGRWSYRRLGETIANFFYKTIVWTFAIFWYQIYDDFDQTYIYDYTYIMLYSLAFTSFPVGIMGVLDQDVSDKVSLAVPQLYRRGIERKEWTQPKFWLYMLDGVYQSVMCYYIPHFLFRTGNFVTSSGKDVSDRNRFGVYIACAAVVVVNTYILLNTYRWDWIILLVVMVSNLLVFTWTGVWSGFVGSANYFFQAAPQVFSQPTFWASTILTIIVCLLPRFTIKAVQKAYFPYDVDVIREQVRQGKFKYLDDANGSSAPTASSSITKMSKHNRNFDDEQRPIYPPSVASTANTHNPRTQNGSDGTE